MIMCLAIPMKVVKAGGEYGVVSSGNLTRKANFTLLKDVRPGDYVLLHAGFAIAKVKPDEAKKTIKILKEL
ncbi:MAG: HypC/HybG/HupF family hydrogenase formation chaperone [Candidatus Omnitrophota bacterium]